MRKISTIGLSVAVLAATGWLAQASAQSAPDATAPAASSDSSTPAAKPMKHHHKSSGMHKGNGNKVHGDAAVEDLNAQSLDAAKSGKAYAPPTSLTPAAAKAPAKTGHHHHKAKAAAAAAPAADATPPADSSK